jgi:hypothetical protein
MREEAILTLPTPTRVPWNKGKLIGPKPPLRQKHVWAIRSMLAPETNVSPITDGTNWFTVELIPGQSVVATPVTGPSY